MNCTLCDGPFKLLGVLGNTAHLRCVNCGHDDTVDASELEEEDENVN